MTTVIGTPLPGVKVSVPGHGYGPRIHTTAPRDPTPKSEPRAPRR